jgi:hypothetical protein
MACAGALRRKDDHLRRGGAMAKKTAASRRSAGRKRHGRRHSGSSRRAAGTGRRWSRQVTEHSDALTLDKGVFTSRDPKRIAASLKRSAERSTRRKSSPFRSALSMLTFYINRAGKNLPASRKKTLMRAKDELRKQFGKA